MRRLASLLLLASLACTAAPREEQGEPLPTGLGLEAGAAVETARAFLEAYADPATVAATHGGLIAGPDLRDWVYWAGVQNSGLEFVPGSSVEVRDLRVVTFDLPVASIAVDALIETRFRTGRGVGERDRHFAALLLQRLQSGWKVVDAVHDARQMTSTITVLEPPVEVVEGPVAVEVQSVFRFSGGTVVNLRALNRGSAPVAVDVERSLLLVGEERLGGQQATTSLLSPVAPGRLVQGGVTFPTIDEGTVPQAVLLRLRGSRPLDVPLELPPEPFLLETAGQSDSNSGGAGASGV